MTGINNQILEKMTLSELKSLKARVQDLIDVQVGGRINQLKVGDVVKVNHSKTRGCTFAILKINRKRCKIQNIKDKKIFNCDFGLIEKVL